MKKIIDRYFTNNDSRGSIEGLINFGNWQEVNYIKSSAGSTRGGHFHKSTEEIFIILNGEIEVTLVDEAGSNESFTVKSGDVFLIAKNIKHTFCVIKDSVWINLLSKRHNPENPDFYNKFDNE